MLDTFWLAQILGFIALACTVIAFQSKTRSRILFGQLTGALFFAIHFLLLSAYTGAAMNALVAGRNAIFSRQQRNSMWLYVFIGLALILGALSWQGWISLFPAVGTIIGACALWQQKPASIRLLLLLSALLWFPYLIWAQSYSGIVNQVIVTTAIVVGILRHDRKRERLHSSL